LSAQWETRSYPPFAFDLDRLSGLNAVAMLQPLVGTRCDLDLAGNPMRCHPTGCVEGVRSQVIGELSPPDHPGHDPSDVDADSKAEGLTQRRCGSQRPCFAFSKAISATASAASLCVRAISRGRPAWSLVECLSAGRRPGRLVIRVPGGRSGQ
jgi:hypothetical protein